MTLSNPRSPHYFWEVRRSMLPSDLEKLIIRHSAHLLLLARVTDEMVVVWTKKYAALLTE